MENMAMINGTDPDKMTATERMDEIAAILAVGLLRLHARHAHPSRERVSPELP